jgi:hypothetical protein
MFICVHAIYIIEWNIWHPAHHQILNHYPDLWYVCLLALTYNLPCLFILTMQLLPPFVLWQLVQEDLYKWKCIVNFHIRKSAQCWYDQVKLISSCLTCRNFSQIINVFNMQQYNYNYFRYFQVNTRMLLDGPNAITVGKFDIPWPNIISCQQSWEQPFQDPFSQLTVGTTLIEPSFWTWSQWPNGKWIM